MKPLVLFLLSTFLLLGSIAHANTTTESPQNPDSIVSRLSDEEVRRLLLEKLNEDSSAKTGAAEKKIFNPAIFAYWLTSQGNELNRQIQDISGAADELPLIFNKGIEKFYQGREGKSGAEFLTALGISFLIAGVITFIIRRFLATIRHNNPEDSPNDVMDTMAKIKHHGASVFTSSALLLAFAITASVIFLLFFKSEARDQLTFFFYLTAISVIGLNIILFNAFYSPRNKQQRLPVFSDKEAKRFFATSAWTIAFGSLAFFTCALISTLGVGGHVHELFLITVTGLTAFFLSVTIIINRTAIRNDLSHLSTSRLRSGFATIWPWLFALGVFGLWMLLVTIELLADFTPYGAALFTIAVMGVIPHVDALLHREEINALDNNDWKVALTRGIRFFIAICIFSTLLFAWGLNPAQLSSHSSAGVNLLGSILGSMLIIVASYAIWQIAKIFINRRIDSEDREMAANQQETEAEIGGAGLSRTRTLLPLLKRTIQITLLVTVFLLVLSEFGIDITPLLAGAGVLGLAIGFGSQTLVRDIVSGAFFLLDDAVRIGEYIDVGSVKGSVEKMSIRSLQLRHHRGAVHTIPFGEIKTLTNHSRDWAIMKLRFRVPFDTDLEKVRKLLKKAGKELAEEEMIKEDFIQPFKSQGAIEADDHGFVISTKFMSKPGKQFLIRRFAFNAIQKAFEANGIQFARPTVTVKSDPDEDNQAPTPNAIAKNAAANNLITEEIRSSAHEKTSLSSM